LGFQSSKTKAVEHARRACEEAERREAEAQVTALKQEARRKSDENTKLS
jgi:hypothetical protein